MKPVRAASLENAFRYFFDSSQDFLAVTDLDFVTLAVNDAIAAIGGYPPGDVIGHSPFDFIHPDDRVRLAGLLATLRRAQGAQRFTARYRIADGTYRLVDWTCQVLADSKVVVCRGRDVTAARQTQTEREVRMAFLEIVARSKSMEELVRAATAFFQEKSGCEAVGVRLKKGEDYPYYETRGFNREFVLAETSLCAKDASGNVIRDADFNPVIECMCGNVICGRFDSAKPFFTEHGSFWSNNTTALLASTSDADRMARTRNRCNGEGYESVALLPLRVGTQRLGLLQLNDRRIGMFSLEVIRLWEGLAGYLAIALSKFFAEESVRESEERYRHLFESMEEGLALCEMVYNDAGAPVDFRYLEVNPAFERLTGLAAAKVKGKLVTEAIPGIEPFWHETYGTVVRTGESVRVENYVAVLGKRFEVYAWRTGPRHFAAIFTDLTQRDKVMQELKDKYDEVERHNRLMLDREMRTIELKNEVNELLQQLGKKQKYLA